MDGYEHVVVEHVNYQTADKRYNENKDHLKIRPARKTKNQKWLFARKWHYKIYDIVQLNIGLQMHFQNPFM